MAEVEIIVVNQDEPLNLREWVEQYLAAQEADAA